MRFVVIASPVEGVLQRPIEFTEYLAIRYTDRLLAAGIDSSVGSRGDAYDNALAESINSLYKAEVIHHEGPWKGLEDVEYAALEWVAWYKSQRLMEPIGYVTPAEYEERYHRAQAGSSAGVLTYPSLRRTRGDSRSPCYESFRVVYGKTQSGSSIVRMRLSRSTSMRLTVSGRHESQCVASSCTGTPHSRQVGTLCVLTPPPPSAPSPPTARTCARPPPGTSAPSATSCARSRIHRSWCSPPLSRTRARPARAPAPRPPRRRRSPCG
ncbi:MAG: integrase core domain-containing protein [Gemmatimonadales bacterium]|nr:transposase [Gemmatimonadota bacterium]MCL4213519.1 integrase core domain-containing protein [Gemmatimonadales bacterium]